jgi:transposase
VLPRWGGRPPTASMCQGAGCRDLQREPPAMSITMIGLDTAKSVFQLHGIDASGKVQLKRKLRRSELIAFFEKQQPCTVVMEACGAAHHWARVLSGLGHEVKLIAPEAVRPFVKRGKKNDAADAAAICAAASRPDAKFVAAKSLEQQSVLALHSARTLLVKQQTMLANALRGLAAEFGLIAPKGMNKLEDLKALVEADEAFPEQVRQVFTGLLGHCRATADRVAALEAEIVAHARQDDTARRLATIPGIGPITASLIAATVGDIGAFKSARHFAAWLGLVPRQRSTGGKTRLGRITKMGNREIRRSLVLGATSMVYRAERWNSAAGAWTRGLLERRPVRLVTVALANKMARIAWALMTRKRIAWALMTRKEVYRAKGRVVAAAEAMVCRSGARWKTPDSRPADPAGSAEPRDGKGCGQDSSGDTVLLVALRARGSDWCLARKRTPMMASGISRATGRT